MKVCVPGANIIVASNPLVVHIVTSALERNGLEPRGQIIRLVQTLRGGDRPKGSESRYSGVTVMPRSCWEPWILMRKPLDGTVTHNLDVWKTGGFKRIADDLLFCNVVKVAPTTKNERGIAPHPSIKPQKLMRWLIRASLPLGEGTVLDPFAGSGSTLAAAANIGLNAVGCEINNDYFSLASDAIPKFALINA